MFIENGLANIIQAPAGAAWKWTSGSYEESQIGSQTCRSLRSLYRMTACATNMALLAELLK